MAIFVIALFLGRRSCMELKMQGITKSFGANNVLKEVDFSLKEGEICALLGENGAGKSTLMNILGGVISADSGEILLDGTKVHFAKPIDSLNKGIAFIHQELNLINDLAIYENMYIGREIKKGRFLDAKTMIENTAKIFKTLDINLDPKEMVGQLDASYKQIVEISRALLMNASIIIMDEPTTSLTEPEIKRVFNMMNTLKDRGVSIIFISHKLKEVMEICTNYTVLRDGVMVASGSVSDTNPHELATYMVGHEVRNEKLSRTIKLGDEVLKCVDLSFEDKFKNINFTLKKGEILGFTGLLGDGRSELFQTVFGCNPNYKGDIVVSGEVVKMKSPSVALKQGIGYVPRNRKENAIIKDLSILENGTIVTLKNYVKNLLINTNFQSENFNKYSNELSIKMGSIDDLITSLSGGNQQKVMLAKWLDSNPSVIVFDNPTQGVDVGAKEEIYDIILKLSESGVGIIILSSEASEIIKICDRSFIMFHGKINGELTSDEMSEQIIMSYATGSKNFGGEHGTN